jgi:hypothetical protein
MFFFFFGFAATFGLLSADPSGNAMALYSHLVSGLLGDTNATKNSEQVVDRLI